MLPSRWVQTSRGTGSLKVGCAVALGADSVNEAHIVADGALSAYAQVVNVAL
jgi:hypothetical protein